MRPAEEIANETDPFLREIYGMGYDNVVQDYEIFEGRFCKVFKLIMFDKKYIKTIDADQIKAWKFKLKTVLTYFGPHTFIASSDGSLERFMEIIKPQFT